MIVLDNYSEDPETLEALRSWNEKGLHVLFNQGPYTQKGELTSKAYHEILPHLDVIIPLDLDEFLVAFDGEQPVVSKSKIYSVLKEFWQSNYSCLALPQYYPNGNFYVNDTVETIEYFKKDVYRLPVAKKIGKARDIVKFDHGNHHAFSHCPDNGRDGCSRPCASAYGQLGLLHYHWLNPEFLARRAVAVSVSRGFLPANFTLEKVMSNKEIIEDLVKRNITERPGGHKIKEILRYITHKPETLVKSSHEGMFKVGKLPDMVRKIEST
jgi:hypothetical protein